jgi:hypothetical protein
MWALASDGCAAIDMGLDGNSVIFLRWDEVIENSTRELADPRRLCSYQGLMIAHQKTSSFPYNRNSVSSLHSHCDEYWKARQI